VFLCVSVCCSVLQCVAMWVAFVAVCCSVLQFDSVCVAVCCSVYKKKSIPCAEAYWMCVEVCCSAS